jgi:AcrR family transcriptional regulator
VFAKKGYHGTSVPEVADASGVGTGTLYRYFENKEALVNEVYRDTKTRLREALMTGLLEPTTKTAEMWFHEVWRRLGAFAKAEPEAFRFLEMQDHVEYLDPKSRQLELSVLMPLLFAGQRLASGRPPKAPLRRERSFRNSEEAAAAVDAGDGRAVPVAVLMALLWGAFVGLVKASRLGYLPLDDKKLAQAGTACWRLIAPELSRSRTRTKGT